MNYIIFILYRGLNGTNPGAFRVDNDGVSVFETPLPDYKYNLEIRAEYSGENLAGWQKAELLHKVAKSLYEIKAIYRAEEVWQQAISVAQINENSENVQDSLDSSSVLAEIAETYGSNGKIDFAVNLARQIKNVGKRERAINNIAEFSRNIKKVA